MLRTNSGSVIVVFVELTVVVVPETVKSPVTVRPPEICAEVAQSAATESAPAPVDARIACAPAETSADVVIS